MRQKKDITIHVLCLALVVLAVMNYMKASETYEELTAWKTACANSSKHYYVCKGVEGAP